MINLIVEYWKYILFAVVLVLLFVYGCMTGKAIEWLKYAVAQAEAKLGSGTGQLKLRKVYDMFIEKYPAFSAIVPFPIFSKMVDVALEWLSIQLESNQNVKSIVEEKRWD